MSYGGKWEKGVSHEPTEWNRAQTKNHEEVKKIIAEHLSSLHRIWREGHPLIKHEVEQGTKELHQKFKIIRNPDSLESDKGFRIIRNPKYVSESAAGGYAHGGYSHIGGVRHTEKFYMNHPHAKVPESFATGGAKRAPSAWNIYMKEHRRDENGNVRSLREISDMYHSGH